MVLAIYLITYFGGVSHFARIVGVSRMCLYKWIKKGNEWKGIPHRFRPKIREYVIANNIDFRESDFESHERIKQIIEKAREGVVYEPRCAVCSTLCSNPVPEHKAPWFCNK